MLETNLSFAAAPRRCAVLVGPGALAELGRFWSAGWRQAALVGDQTVLGLFGPAVVQALGSRVETLLQLSFEPGEASKTRSTKQRLEDGLLAAGFERGCCVIGLGGGVSLDLAGFVAATYRRGVDWLALPTSLLAQVDAALGGKTGVDTPQGKNLVGAFHQPRALLVDPELPASLPPIEWRCGLAEMVKAAFIADAALFAELESRAAALARPGPLPAALVQRCLQIKAGLVQADEREAGRRAWLNFGHTVGHAVERASGFAVPHGLAVARGMLVEARLAVRRTGLAPEAVARLERLLAALGFGELPAPDFARLAGHLLADKKNRDGRVRAALPAALGAMAGGPEEYTVPVEPDELSGVYLP